MNLKSFDSAVLRTPLLPLPNANELSPQKIVDLFLNNYVLQEALYLATPSLYQEFKNNFSELDYVSYTDKQWRIILSLTKYYNRMSTRCTPFGLFSGCSLLTVSADTKIVLPESNSLNAHVRLDMNYLNSLCANISNLESIKKYVKYTVNTGIYFVGDKIRYFEYYYQRGIRFHRLSAITKEYFAERLLNILKIGASISEINNFFLSEGYEKDEIINYINEMIEQKFIINTVEPTVTGDEMLPRLIQDLQAILDIKNIDLNDAESISRIIYVLNDINGILTEIDNSLVGLNKNQYDKLISLLPRLGVEFNQNFLFQADLIKRPIDGEIGIRIIDKIKKGVYILNKIANYRFRQPEITTFKRKFYERYEEKQVPLLEALDQEIGIGYPADKALSKQAVNVLLKGIFILDKTLEQDSFSATNNDLLWIQKINDCTSQGLECIELNDEDLETLGSNKLEFDLSTISVNAKIINQDNDFDYDIVISGTGFCSSGASLIARFGHADKQIANHSLSITQYEELDHPHQLLAEIVHLPDARVGNVIQRPLLRKYEIPFLAKSALDDDSIIRLEDLLISIKNNRVILYSSKHKKEIIPKLTNAHNFFHKSLPIYRFLCDLQFEQSENSNFGFEPTTIIKKLCPAIPRIKYQDIIISPARWFFDTSSKDFPLNHDNIEDWLKKNFIPKKIVLSEGDNDLYIDFDSSLNVSVFLSEINKKKSFEIKEFLFNKKQKLVLDSEYNDYANEVIASFYNIDSKQYAFSNTEIYKSSYEIANTFISGDEWFYFKIYAGSSTIDYILRELISPAIKQLLQSGLISKWFFIRYNDPEHHLRLRVLFTGSIDRKYEVMEVINAALKQGINGKLVWKVQQDTYQREVERYSAAAIHLVEKLFFIDSEFYIHFLSVIPESEYDNYKLVWALLCMDNMLSMFHADTESKAYFSKVSYENFASEFGNSKSTRISLDIKYRELKNHIENIFKRQVDFSLEMSTALELKSKACAPIIDDIVRVLGKQGSDSLLYTSKWSYIHMMINRIFNSEQRVNEMTCYFLISKYYTSVLARKNR